MTDLALTMKRDWDSRASENARWYINTLSHQQTDEEFDLSGRREFEGTLIPDLAILTDRRAPSKLRFLEIGCGIGRMTRFIAAIFGEVVAVDVSAEMIRQAKNRLAGDANVICQETNGVDFNQFADESFDLVFAAYVFQHVPSAAVIESNIREAYRLLKPQGVFKFVTNAVHSEHFPETSRDTWAGASFPGSEVRSLAGDMGAQLLGVHGDGTQYCWSVIRKRPGTPRGQARNPEIVFVGRAEDMMSTDLAPRLGDAFVGLIVKGVDYESVDINSVTVEFRGSTLAPFYCGPTAVPPLTVINQEALEFDRYRIQVSVRIPADEPAGEAELRVRFSGAVVSDAVKIVLPEVQTAAPVIDLVINTVDKGIDVCATGPKSQFKVLFHVDERTDVNAVEVLVDELRVEITPEGIGFLPANGLWQVTAQLPDGTAPRDVAVRVAVEGRVSEPFSVSLK
ncbi:MAG: class I SAM-dependent methyltransferase [Acidobacteriota bacterium]